MTNKKNTRKALLMSCLSLLLCVSMLIGTTFAWFTDSVSSTANKIIAGNLDVDVLYVDSEGNQTSIQDVDTLFNDVALWEPGAVAFENLTVVNEGTLALKYQLSINFTNENYVEDAEGNQYRLSQVLEVAIVPGGVPENMTRQQLMDYVNEKGISWNGLMDDFRIGELYPADNMPTDDPNAVSQYTYGVVIRWQPGPNDNDYNINNGKHVSDWENDPEKNFLHIDLGINLFATQLTYEEDSWDDQYDAAAQLVGGGSAKLGVGEVAVEIHARDTETGYKVGSVVVDKDSIADPNQHVTINYTPSEYAGNFTIAAGLEKKVVDISVTNLREGNNVPVKATIRLAKGMDPETVKLYHYDQEIPCTYNPETGYVTFETTSFSPFTAVYDAESVYVPPVTEEPDEGEEKPSDLPNANVVNAPQYENVALPWGSYGGWSPTEGQDSELEAAYIFTCLETPEEAANNPYAQWYCDFVVMLDRDLGENQLFLGGNYGSFGWVGFHNGELTLEAGTEVPLLGSVTTNPWTYLDVATYVGEFICGVGDVNDALAGATFTVMLRLTNPADETEFYNVATVTYKFANTTVVNNAADLSNALTTGGKIALGADIELTQNITVPAGVTAVLDLNGHKITGTAAAGLTDLITNNGNLTIKGEGEIAMTYNGANVDGKAVNAIGNRGVLYVNGGKISNTGEGMQIGYAIDNYNGATLTVNAGEITASGSGYYDGIRLFCGSKETIVTVNGGKVSSIWAQNPSANKATEVQGTVILNGGEITATYFENYTIVKVATGFAANVIPYGEGKDNTTSTVVDGYTVYSFVHNP